MLLTEIVRRVNELLAGETLSYTEMRPYLDQAIDDVNQLVNATFPVFSDLTVGETEYDMLPDRYLRTVVTLGAALHYYMTDEEGSTLPAGYLQRHEQAKFLMLRDYIHAVPAEYQDCSFNGVVGFNLTGAKEIDTGIQQGDMLI